MITVTNDVFPLQKQFIFKKLSSNPQSGCSRAHTIPALYENGRRNKTPTGPRATRLCSINASNSQATRSRCLQSIHHNRQKGK